jgi:hypothetical protein
MAHDLVAALKKEIREAESRLAWLKETLRKETGSHPGVLDGGHLLRKPDGWNVADDIKKLLDNGKKTMPRDELVTTLVEGDLVKGATSSVKVASARRAITMGELKGYLRIKNELVHWVPGIYENPRLRKNI